MKRSKSILMRSAQVLLNIFIAFFVFYDVMGMGDKATLTGVKAFMFFGIPQLTILEMFWERKSTKLSRQRYFLGWWVGAYVLENIAFWILPVGKVWQIIGTLLISVVQILFATGIFKGRYTLPTGVSMFQIAFSIYVAYLIFQKMTQSVIQSEEMDSKTWMAIRVFLTALLPLIVTWIQTHNKSGIGVDIFIGLFMGLLISVAWSIAVENIMHTRDEFYFAVSLGSLIYLGYLSVAGKPTKLLDLLKSVVPADDEKEEEEI